MKVCGISFSPTGGTRKAALAVAEALSDTVVSVDLTDSAFDFGSVRLDAGDVAVIATPAYGGRVPAVAIQRLAQIQGNGAWAILMAVYGNRAFEDTLVELEDTAKAAGFSIAAGVGAVAEHSIARQFAAGRPDEADCKELADFARQIAHKLEEGGAAPVLPGNRPYKKAGGSGMVPKATDDCVRCGLCAAKCPVNAIDKADPKKVNGDACISCMRCVAVCPHDARKVNGVMLAAVGAMLKKVCSEPKKNELFL